MTPSPGPAYPVQPYARLKKPPSCHPFYARARRKQYYAFSTISAPGPKFVTSTLLPSSCLSIALTSSFVYFLVFTDMTESPVLSLSSSCALIQHLAIRFCAISIPPGEPAATLPPRYQGFSTRSKECRRSVRGSAATDTR